MNTSLYVYSYITKNISVTYNVFLPFQIFYWQTLVDFFFTFAINNHLKVVHDRLGDITCTFS